MKFVRAVRLSVLIFAPWRCSERSPPSRRPCGEHRHLEPTADAKEAAYPKNATCKKTPVVGTRISKTVCQTAAQRDAERAASQKYLQNVQDAAGDAIEDDAVSAMRSRPACVR